MLARQPCELRCCDPSALGDHAVDIPIRPRLRRRENGMDVEHLATADGLVAARLAQDVTIARKQRNRLVEVDPDQTRVTGGDRFSAEDAYACRELAGADVCGIRAPPRHLVAESRQYAQRR